MHSTILSSKVVIRKPISEVWQILKNPGSIKVFHPLIKESCMITEQNSGVGAKRLCHLKPMGEMEEVISEWIEKKLITTEVIGGKYLPPYSFMRGNLRINSIDDNKTEVIFTFEYQLKYGLLGQFINILFIRPQFKNAPHKYTSGLKGYIEG